MKLYDRLDFRTKVTLHAMLAAGVALVLVIVAFTVFDGIRFGDLDLPDLLR